MARAGQAAERVPGNELVPVVPPPRGELVRLGNKDAAAYVPQTTSLPERVGRWIGKAVRFVKRMGRRVRRRFGRPDDESA